LIDEAGTALIAAIPHSSRQPSMTACAKEKGRHREQGMNCHVDGLGR
jgi:hypothetical protein